MSNNRISVVIPAYNSDATICVTLDSLLNQQHPPDEVIVVDDHGTKPVSEVLGSQYPEVRVIRHHTNMGVHQARNTGFAEATGDYVYFLDADDILCPEYLKITLKALEENPKAAAAFGAFYKCFDGNAEPLLRDHLPQDPEIKLLPKGQGLTFYLDHTGAFIPSFSIFRKSVLQQISRNGELFSTALDSNEDFQMFARVLAISDVLYIENPMGVYFLRPDSISRNQAKIWSTRADAVDLLIGLSDELELSNDHITKLKEMRATAARLYARVLANSGAWKKATRHLVKEFKRSPQIKTLALLFLVSFRLQRKKIEYGGKEY
jgi:glycosyltransferase involved in cell wall biosynthesis